jgi:cobalt-zinc-cadmium resistance protein CzcA
MILYCAFNSLRSMLVMAGVPLGIVGGVWGLYLTGVNFSISAAVGVISLLGVAVMGGIILLSTYEQFRRQGTPHREAVLQSALTRMRPLMMTCLSASIGLLPSAISTGIGSQTQRPLAIVIVGGMLLAPLLILVFMPVVFAVFIRDKGAAST